MATMETIQPGETQAADQTKTATYRYETTYTGNTGNDLGISTAGYRTGKYNPDEWHTANYKISCQSTVDRDRAGKVCHYYYYYYYFLFVTLYNDDAGICIVRFGLRLVAWKP